ncbi:MAG: thermonuclease family protein [bacterium]|nr:thermonuclease family protein [bacterium]
MLKKILYGLGGVFLLFTIMGALAPVPKAKVAQVEEQTKQATPNEGISMNAEATTSVPVPVVVKSEIRKQASTSVAPPILLTSSSTPQYAYYSVVSVIDGDTIKVNVNGVTVTLRLIGMDTPETVDPRKPVQCFGKEASSKAKELLANTKVRLEKDSTQGELDKYGRTLAYAYREDGLFYNKYMIEQGYAHEYTYNTPYRYQVEFKAAQKSAQENAKGLWSSTTCSGDTTAGSNTAPQSVVIQGAGKYYTSSHYSAKYYYPESCDGWQSLSAAYLKSFDLLESLLLQYPTRVKGPQCI